MRLIIQIAALVSCVVLTQLANAHTIRPAVATAEITPGERIELTVRTNVEVLLADIGPEYADTSESPNAARYDQLRAMAPAELAAAVAEFAVEFTQQPLLLVDGQSLALTYSDVDVPPVGDLSLARNSTIHFRAQLASGNSALQWQWPAEFGTSVIRFRQADASNATTQSQWLQAGQISDTYSLASAPVEVSSWSVIGNYISIGFEHILPKGLDHILFVVGIFLLSVHLRPILLQVTAFTLAHTITLGLSIYGLVALPASVVEPLIALSIAYVAIENCLSPKLSPWRIALVFCFGLLHGLGFAGVLSEIGLPRSEFLTALLSFNVGVELGQLAVISGCLLLLGWWRNRDWYRQRVVIPLSICIAATGLFWTWERIFA
jgi:hydrogenase/urease accessory protein HupE